ncbi:toxin-antitoxin system YwqK family antitoxin [Flavobacterium sp. P21]|uniref:toxin-antitoxin system YwqK family antitoxin n=1 Tax=Flavobacterium sp. P21 TaxID=3423948 RepID=UPI003D66F757
MKTYTIPRYIIFFFAFALVSFSDPYMIKRISDKDFRYEFYTTDKKVNPKINKTYSWFKGGLIHEAQGGIGGDLLNDKFVKMYHSNQLAEQGEFKNGLRVGLWKTWHQNGVLATTLSYSKGLKSGKYFRYDKDGNLVENGKFSSGLKTGKWTNAESKEIITYRKGEVVKKKQTFTKSEKYKIKQDAQKLENAEKNQKELDAISDAEKLAGYKAKAKEEKTLEEEKAKRDRETKKVAQKTARENKKLLREQAKNEPKKDSKITTFFKNIFKKKDKAPQ